MHPKSDPEKTAELALRREQVARLTAEGLSPVQIAQQLKVPVVTLARDLAFVAKVWQQMLERDPAMAKAHELAKINRLEAVAWEAWERSCRDEESTKVTVDGDKKRAEKVTKNQSGNAKFLDRVAWCIEKRFDILALAGTCDSIGGGGHADNIPVEQRRQRILALLDIFRERERVAAARQGTVDIPAGHSHAADSAAAVG